MASPSSSKVKLDRARRQPQQIAERRLLRPHLIHLLRPSERLEQPARVEDAPTRALGPIGVDQTDEIRVIGLGKSRRHGIDQMNAGAAAPRREGPALERVMNRADELLRLARFVVMAAKGVRETVEHAEHRRAGPQMAILPVIIGGLVAMELAQES